MDSYSMRPSLDIKERVPSGGCLACEDMIWVQVVDVTVWDPVVGKALPVNTLLCGRTNKQVMPDDMAPVWCPRRLWVLIARGEDN